MTALRSWWRRNVIAVDPRPDLSRLDRADGLGVWLTDEQCDELASEVLRRQREVADGRQR